MNLAEFRESLQDKNPPVGLSYALQALWWDGKGNWERAHESAQQDEGTDGAWVHAYLHRKEGELANAQYWYRRAEHAAGYGDLQREWESMVGELLRSSSQ